MFRCKSFFFVALTAVLYSAVASAEQNETKGESTGSQKQQQPSEKSTEPSKDAQFLPLLRARDAQIVVIGELRRIISYHEGLRTRVDRLLSGIATTDRTDRDQPTRVVTGEIERLSAFEREVKASNQLSVKIAAAKKFDEMFPLSILDLRRPTSRPTLRTLAPPDRVESDPTSFVPRERNNANDVFQNMTGQNKELRAQFDRIFSSIETALGQVNLKYPSLDALPSAFYDLAGNTSFEKLTAEQIQSGIDKYRKALDEVQSAIKAPKVSIETVRPRIISDVDELGKDLQKKLNAAGDELRELERSISATAKSVYGNKVGSESFNYLLLVFAGVFLIVMLAPKFYAPIVAENVLKSEFLLQFSTVFVLIAAIIILGIGDLIDKSQLPVLLAGISGYVLGQLGKK